MKHLILTRFNVLMPGWNSQINLDANWLDNRFKLFEKICLPSVITQTNQNFDWLVFFDANTSEKYKLKINNLVKKYAFQPIYVSVFDLKEISSLISNGFSGDEMLLTSRLDSDDALAVDYVTRVQTLTMNFNDKRVINFDDGAILFSKNNQHSLYKYEDKSNPFTSFLEPFKAGFSTILAVNHTDLHQFAKVIHVKGKPMWLQVVHGGNVSNRVRGLRVELSRYNDDFLYMQSISKGKLEGCNAIWVDNYILGSYRFLKEFIRTYVKRVYLCIKK